MTKRFIVVLAALLALCASCWASAAEIHVAAAKGDAVKIEKLLKAKPALVNLADKDGAAPLHYAAAKNQVAVVKLLLANKADVNAKKKDGVTPLHVAAALGYKEIVELLLDAKSDMNATDKKNRTPLSVAETNGKTAVVELLKTRAASAMTSTSPAVPPVVEKRVPPPTPPTMAIPTDPKMLAEKFVDLVSAGKYSEATGYFDSNMKSQLSAPKLAEIWQTVQGQVGKFKSRAATRTDKIDGFDVVNITCEFESAKFDAQMAFNANSQISGFYVLNPNAQN
ncbi:MAG: ankyrin repeat domain-containing protein [Armatimonadota bacterium]